MAKKSGGGNLLIRRIVVSGIALFAAVSIVNYTKTTDFGPEGNKVRDGFYGIFKELKVGNGWNTNEASKIFDDAGKAANVAMGKTASDAKNGAANVANDGKDVANNVANDASQAANDAKNAVEQAKDEAQQKANDASQTIHGYTPLAFKGKKQMVMQKLDRLNRAVGSHIQLTQADKPTEDRNARLDYDPVGWHNYRFTFTKKDGSIGKAWLMNRGHLVGYQFCGLNDEPRNLVPETAYLNQGAIDKNDSSNPNAMLFYEYGLSAWLKNFDGSYLDYQVTPIYSGDELIPRQVKLSYVGLTPSGKELAINLGGNSKAIEGTKRYEVILDNVSSNANIDYTTGTATQK
jgi:DNA-entry nuclease